MLFDFIVYLREWNLIVWVELVRNFDRKGNVSIEEYRKPFSPCLEIQQKFLNQDHWMFLVVSNLLKQLSQLEGVYQFELDLIVIRLGILAVLGWYDASHNKYLIGWVC